MSKTNNIDMTQGPFLKKIIWFAIPIMLNSLLQTAYSTADSIVVGRFEGSDALAAVSSNGPLWFFLVTLFISITTAAGTLISRAIGAKNTKIISNAVHTAISMSLIFGIIIMIVGFIFSKTFLTWMSVPDNIIDLSTTYLKIIFLGCPANMFYNAAAAIFRSKGESKTPLIIQSISGLLNVILNLIFVIVFKMSVAGVALSTVISQYVSAIWFATLLIKSNDYCKLYIKKLTIHKTELIETLHIGIPSGITNVINYFVNITLQTMINSFGSAVIAGVSASTSIINIVFNIVFAISNTSSVFTAQNYGAKNKANIKKIVSLCSVLCSSISLILSALLILFRRETLWFFTTDTAAIDAGSYRIIFETSFHFISSVSSILNSALISMRKSVAVMIYGLVMTLGVRFMWYIFIFPLNPELYMLYILTPITACIGFFVYNIMYRHTLKNLEF